MGVFANRVEVFTSSTGTGAVVPGAATSNAVASFSEAGIPNNATVTYCIEEGNDFEIGPGVYTTAAGGSLTRPGPYLSKIGGTAGTSLMNLTGAAKIRIVVAKEDIIRKPATSTDRAIATWNGTAGDELRNNSAGPLVDANGRIILGGLTNVAEVIGGTSTPFMQFHGVAGNGNADMVLARWSPNSGSATLYIAKSRAAGSVVGVYTVVQNNDDLGVISFQGADGTDFAEAAQILAEVDGTPGDNDMPGRIVFLTSPDGSATPGIAAVIKNNNNFGIATGVSPDRRFHAEEDNAATATVVQVGRLTATSQGTPAVNFGVGLEFEVETAAGNNEVGATVEAVAAAVGSGTEQIVLNSKQMSGGSQQEPFGLSFLHRSLTANAGYTNNTSAQPWFPSNGAVTLEASTTYEFEGVLMLTTGSTSHTLGLSFGGTATLTSIGYFAHCAMVAINTASASTVLSVAQITQASNTVVSAANTAVGNTVFVKGIVRINAAGTLIPQFTFSAAPGAGNVLANTHFKLRKIGSNTNTAQGPWG